MRRLLKLFSDLPIARKLLLASVIPVLTVISLSIVTYRSVENFSEDESELNTLYLSQRLAAEYLRLVVDLEADPACSRAGARQGEHLRADGEDQRFAPFDVFCCAGKAAAQRFCFVQIHSGDGAQPADAGG